MTTKNFIPSMDQSPMRQTNFNRLVFDGPNRKTSVNNTLYPNNYILKYLSVFNKCKLGMNINRNSAHHVRPTSNLAHTTLNQIENEGLSSGI